jgi:hypothetical protein
MSQEILILILYAHTKYVMILVNSYICAPHASHEAAHTHVVTVNYLRET